ncbi:uncharacterized protein MELLADRAFT_104095 [Melampsora larici-populina 98AG31]|uniref:Uncharacterized protein n=1 Tax=Melampsora larici-populina (strain 98AG31 / pathotype 3-4-7) TaxID=747676 RepID=F4RDJ4_MELLP|nr:uncharacterized protein MELLADRAFT_104095 [Melampsora larici-populina 98AG31]EGG09412.1 hypothetical protein MELLADRAFT_104095 [Melampsora larici-populina 98AG31]
MPTQPRKTASLSAILTSTSDATLLRLPGPQGGVAWHKSETELVLKDAAGQPVLSPLKAYGYVMADETLTRNHTYHIHGAVGVDEHSAAFIRHSSITQTLVATTSPNPANLAGKAMISSIGKVLHVAVDNVDEDDGEWHLTVQAEHEIYDPELSEMGDIEINSLMWFVGCVVSKESNQFIVQMDAHGGKT